MTQSKSFTTAALVAVTTAATTLFIQACGGDATAQTSTPAAATAAAETAPIEGVWESNVIITDCVSGAVQRMFKGVTMFHRGGSLSGDNSLPPASRGAAFGNWKRDSAAGFTANFRFFRFNADGSWAGSQKVQRTLTLGADNNTLTGTIAGQVIDTAGVVLQPICGNETAVRIY